MDTFSKFAHLAELSKASPHDRHERVKVSLSLRLDDVYLVDRMSKSLGMTRQDFISTILHTGLPDAVRGYFKIAGDDPLEHLSWDEFQEKVEQGEYFQ